MTTIKLHIEGDRILTESGVDVGRVHNALVRAYYMGRKDAQRDARKGGRK